MATRKQATSAARPPATPPKPAPKAPAASPKPPEKKAPAPKTPAPKAPAPKPKAPPLSAHDREVKQLAERNARNGGHVSADHVPGYPQPRIFGRKYPTRPDLVVERRGKTTLIEVETESSLNSPETRQQLETLNRSVAQLEDTTLLLKVVKDG